MQSQSPTTPPKAPASLKKRHKSCAHADMWLRPAPPTGFKFPAFLRKLGLQQPDCHRNPYLWPTRLVYGHSILDITLQATRAAQSILIAGDSAPWLVWEVARANPKARIFVFLADRKRIEWSRNQFQERWPEQLDILEFSSDVEQLLKLEESRFDLIIWNFLGRTAFPHALQTTQQVDQPAEPEVPAETHMRQRILSAMLSSLRQEGKFIYYEAAAPSPLNLERWGRWRHFWGRLGSGMSDPWNQRRAVENLYQGDALRENQDIAQEVDVFRTLQAKLQLLTHRRNRPLIDTLLTGVADRRLWFNLWSLLAWDSFCLSTGLFDGCCRFATLTKK